MAVQVPAGWLVVPIFVCAVFFFAIMWNFIYYLLILFVLYLMVVVVQAIFRKKNMNYSKKSKKKV